ncbi:SesB protein [Nannizzia gypsea CBS 118893]|uniref:SesB protein n=1 Tax=Arthroderma gypseum (strain ATCC MYA-4604 / CBS 118893) TaxID=535722 RepID=E4V1R0_ARTGP|nr:SesB protein [Nannizzia gypsea CBS 118893]EFR03975.1 SesB protein [Nannizzia gypsea CBS 118893]
MERFKGFFSSKKKKWLKSASSSDSTLPAQPGSSRRSQTPPSVNFPDGVEVLHNCPDASVDICFIHGLTGDRDKTWTGDGQSRPWPETLLPSQLPRARILTYGYDAYVVRASVASSNRLIDHATNLLNDLTTDRARNGVVSRPLIFVAHSLGGLVCKEAILLSRNNPEPHLRGLFEYTKAIAFMGTPHGGSSLAGWVKMPVSAFGLIQTGNKALLQLLQTKDQFLESVDVSFSSMIREVREAGRRFEVTCFFEELGKAGVGTIVSKESATLESYNSFSIHANHSDMVKFSSAEDTGFQRLLGELVRWESQIGGDSAARPPGEEEAAKADRPVSTRAAVPVAISHYGSGNQFNALGGSQNNNTGSGNQFLGNISGPVTFAYK